MFQEKLYFRFILLLQVYFEFASLKRVIFEINRMYAYHRIKTSRNHRRIRCDDGRILRTKVVYIDCAVTQKLKENTV